MAHEHASLIDSLGGGTVLAETLAERTGRPLPRDNVYKWKDNGVPWKWRGPVAELARERGVHVPENFVFGEAMQ